MRNAEFKNTIIEEINNATTARLIADTALTVEELFNVGKLTETQHDTALKLLNEKHEQLKGQNKMTNETVETVKGEIVAISEKEVNATIKRVQNKINSIEKGYLSIIGDVAKLKEADAHKTRNFKNFYIMCQELFGMSRGTVHNLLSIYERFGDGNYQLTDEAKEMSVRQMLEIIANEKNSKIETTAEANSAEEANGDEATETSESKNVSRETLATLEITTANVDEVFEAIKSALGAGEADGELTFKITISK